MANLGYWRFWLQTNMFEKIQTQKKGTLINSIQGNLRKKGDFETSLEGHVTEVLTNSLSQTIDEPGTLQSTVEGVITE